MNTVLRIAADVVFAVVFAVVMVVGVRGLALFAWSFLP